MKHLLNIENLSVSISENSRKETGIVNGVDIGLDQGQILAVVGESGSGKTTTAMAVMGLLRRSLGYKTTGSVMFEGKNLLRLKAEEMYSIRGKDISMVFQEPLTALHPHIPVGNQIKEILEIHNVPNRTDHKKMVLKTMHEVGLPDPERLYSAFPSELSGGLKQRAVIAMSIIMRPKLLIADEPTTALDVTTQAQILTLLTDLKRNLGLSVMLITHDLGVVAEMADHAAVMYCGKILEYGPVAKIFKKPGHPYTLGLLKCIPYIDEKKEELYSIPGLVPRPSGTAPRGCAFYPRCRMRIKDCLEQDIGLTAVEDEHYTRCPLWKEI